MTDPQTGERDSQDEHARPPGAGADHAAPDAAAPGAPGDAAPDDAAPGDAAPGDTAPGDAARQRRTRRPLTRRGRAWLVVVVVLVVLLAVGGWVAWRGYQAYDALTRAESVASSLRGALSGADLESVEAALPELREATDQAVTATSDPVWRATGVLPWLGPNVRAVTDVSTALDLLVDGVLEPLADGGLDPSAMLPADGRFDVEMLREIGPRVRAAAEQATRAEELVTAIDPEPLVDPLAERLPGLQDVLGDAASGLRTAADVLKVLPGIVGADGPRSYLVLVLNNAELRTAGGIVGAVAVVGADDGRLGLSGYSGAADLGPWDEPVLPLQPGEGDVHGDRMARWMQNVTMSPHFPRTARLAAEMWRLSTGQEVDAVVAVDPVALSYLLEATGPVPAPGVELHRDNVVAQLLSESYRRFPEPADSDAFFAGAASSVFSALTAGRASPQSLLSGLSRAADERRISLWSTHDAEQELLAGSPLAGEFFGPDHAGAVGVFLDDGTAGKMDYYLRSEVTVGEVVCTEGTTTATVDLVLRSDAPADPTTLPEYVLGPLPTGVPDGSISTNVTVYAPVDGELVSLRRGTSAIGGRVATEADRQVAVLASLLAPGEEQRFAFDVRLAAGVDHLEVWTTPVIGTPGRVEVPGCDGSIG